jgi:hypothetical protein
MRQISELIVRMAEENPNWGYTRIEGALTNLSHKVGRGTIANVLRRNGIAPSPERSRLDFRQDTPKACVRRYAHGSICAQEGEHDSYPMRSRASTKCSERFAVTAYTPMWPCVFRNVNDHATLSSFDHRE